MKIPSIKDIHSVAACTLLVLFSSMSYAATLSVPSPDDTYSAPYVSDGSDGNLTISGPITLIVPDTKIFNFTTFSIFEGGVLDFFGATSTDNIQIFATGDVLIDGILNAMPSMLTITTPGSITINGSINFGESLTLSASTISITGILDGTDYRYPLPDANPGTITLAVPEPETYGMLLAGLSMIGFMAHRRKAKLIMSRLLMSITMLITALLFTNGAHAVTNEYSFENNVIAFPFSPTNTSQTSIEVLSAPYASMVVTDVHDGVDISLTINESFTGWIETISFDYIPQLGFGSITKSTDPTTTKPYYYSDPNGVNGFGASFFGASSTILTFLYGNPFGENLTIHFRNLPDEVDATSFVPQYLSVREAYGWGKASNNTAYVLASTVAAIPEPETSGLFLAGLGILGFIARRRSISIA